jgi:signal transduction histidine kinase
MLTLLVLQGPDRGRRFEMPDRPTLIGRERANVRLDDTTCSRRHAELRPSAYGDRWTVRDLNSSNGTWLNGNRVFGQPTPIKSGDQLRVGKTLLLFGAAAGVSRAAGEQVTLETPESGMDSSIVSTLPTVGNDDSVVLAVPEPAAAAMSNLKVLYRLAAALGSQFTTDQVLDVVLDLVFETVKADRAVVLLYDAEGELVPQVVRRRDEDPDDSEPADDAEEATASPIRASRTIVDHVLRTGDGVLCSNAMADRRFRSGQSVQRMGIRSALCVPIKARRLDARAAVAAGTTQPGDASDDAETLGVLYVDSSVQSYTYGTEQLRLLSAFGLQTGLALQNARLYRQGLRAERLAAVGETAAALSHSVKNILQALKGGVSVVNMARRRRDWNQLDKGWQVVDRNLDRIYGLTMNLLAYAKPREPERRLMNPGRVIDECVDLVAPLAERRGAMVFADIAEDQPPVPIDPEGLHQVLMNLLSNAIDALQPSEPGELKEDGTSSPGPTGLIRVTCRYDAEGKRTILTVEDNGRGIDPNVRRHLFELFHSTKGNRGTGLGLPVAKKVVEEHGGTIDVESEAGRGTTFRITLPAFAEQADDPAHTHVGDA